MMLFLCFPFTWLDVFLLEEEDEMFFICKFLLFIFFYVEKKIFPTWTKCEKKLTAFEIAYEKNV
jgi:hypothetical protein